MHLLFLGIVKTVTVLILEWSKTRGKYTKLVAYIQKQLDDVSSFNLQWLKLIRFNGGKMAGWVSENYIALS